MPKLVMIHVMQLVPTELNEEETVHCLLPPSSESMAFGFLLPFHVMKVLLARGAIHLVHGTVMTT